MEGRQPLPACDSVLVAVILVGVNNMDRNEVGDIVATIMSSAAKIKEKHSHLHVVITGILPKGRQESSLRVRIRQTNALLRYQCGKLPYLSSLNSPQSGQQTLAC